MNASSPRFAPSRLVAWSIRRELWQHRSVILAPLAIGLVFALGTLLAAFNFSDILRQLQAIDPRRQQSMLILPFDLSAEIIRMVAFFAGLAYCLDALYSERRDRSILFWKSLPVSDVVAVIAKAGVPMVVLPIATFAIIVATQVLMLAFGTVAFAVNGASASQLWTEVPLARMTGVSLYTLFTLTLWHAPLYAWLMLISSWARRAPFLWAVLPPLALVILEGIAFRTSHVSDVIKARILGGYGEAFVEAVNRSAPLSSAAMPDPVKFFTSPWLWVGLVVAAALIAAAIWLRRRSEPL